jgi:hypothetical protein
MQIPLRVPHRLVHLLVLACACLLPVATAHADAPANDLPGNAQEIKGLDWTSLAKPLDIVVQASDWGDATIGPEDGDPPTCTGSTGFRSMWYRLAVPEAAVLRVTVVSTDSVRFQPVVSVLDPSFNEVACGLANDAKQGSTANATAYVTPALDGTPATYLVRVAEVVNNSPVSGLPMLTVRFAARDVTPPRILVDFPSDKVQPRVTQTYDASGTLDAASQVNASTAHWVFHDKTADGRDVERMRDGLRVPYTWQSPGSHQVDFRVSDFAGNENMYRFTTLVRDSIRPEVSFFMGKPARGAHRLSVIVGSSESVRVRLLVTQVGRDEPLFRRTVKFWGNGRHKRSIVLRGAVGPGLLVVSGIARDAAGNASALPQCVVDPSSAYGACTSP